MKEEWKIETEEESEAGKGNGREGKGERTKQVKVTGGVMMLPLS